MEKILEIIEKNISSTGYTDLSLTALHTGAYSKIEELGRTLYDKYSNKNISFSFPSLRPDCLTKEIVQLNRMGKKSGFTLAPEAGTERLRKVINKHIDQDEFLHGVETIYSQRWKLVKLYFMIGLPTETEEDLNGIVDLTLEVLRIGRSFHRKNCSVNVSISTFIPKPHTPFQWLPMDSVETIIAKQDFIRKKLKHPQINFKYHDIEQSVLENLFSRGDRNHSKLIVEAYKKGCRLDNWSDEFRTETWKQVVDQSGIPSNFLTLPDKPEKIPLPWDHIDCGIEKQFFLDEYSNSLEGISEPDCNRKVCRNFPGKCAIPRKKSRLETSSINSERTSTDKSGQNQEKPEIFTMRCRYQKRGRFRFLSHLEMSRIIHMAVMRAKIPIDYSKGFNPKPKISFFYPLPVGTESLMEWLDISLLSSIPENEFLQKINKELPEELQFSGGFYVKPSESSLGNQFSKIHYEITVPTELINDYITFDDKLPVNFQSKIDLFLDLEKILIRKVRKGAATVVDIKPNIIDMRVNEINFEIYKIGLDLNLKAPSSIRPEEILSHFLELDSDETCNLRVCRKNFS
ncbi:MAG: hypothetical protein A2161_03650 [Candidatus Schekmanbacteria bacterium RBG_13_48_7]|uniref:Elp3/MiaA/NifB-like radical SAM core domain-containing protein n=1 Tax=Candidatus Schekmanbacteria bacterium RBG_13_48_7 TaxID=1817878 RepID=A0A1F7RR33_9BACT|nr:MAG: hypothetical protein A2161_03650 [Candidatus Schekmanbacteria bacterium RBG_13_48_7]